MKPNFYLLFSILLMLGSLNAFAQIGIGTTTPAASAALEVTSSSNNKGVLIPRITATQKDAISSPAQGLLIYQTTAPIGFYYYIGTAWKLIANQADTELKVDKIAGKDLSSNDYTTAEKTKLAAITGSNTGDQTTITGNAGTATKLATARNINGVAFDGSADITIAAVADAGTLTGTTLKSTVTGSSLISVGTLANLTVTAPIVGSLNGNAGTATKLAASKNINGVAFDGSADITVPAATETLTGTTLKSTITGSSLTSVGTLANLTVTNPIVGSVTGNAGTATTATTVTTNANLTGPVTSVGNATTITDGAITNAKITDVAATKITGNFTSATVNGKVIVGASSAASASAVLEASSTTQGFLPPRMTTAQIAAITSPAAGLLVWCSDCGVGELNVYNGTAWKNITGGAKSAVLTVGQSFQGGTIAYILVSGDPGYVPNATHGLIAATSDQTSGPDNGIQWYNGNFGLATGATGTAIGTGLSNTNSIITIQGATSTSYAAGLARAYTGGGYTDWYLPSRDELYQLFLNRDAIGGFCECRYWSSSQLAADPTSAYLVGFYDFYTHPLNAMSPNQVYSHWSVRAIRSF